MNEDVLWVEKYRPHKIADCILPENMKTIFQAYVDKNEVPNMILSGGPGMGKTTVARALCDELGLDYILINASNERNIETLRTKIVGYAGAVSLTGGRKAVIMDEADHLNPESTQPAFRGVIEEFAGNCSFIFTCNYKNKIIPALHSRMPPVDFQIPLELKPKLMAAGLKRMEEILTAEKVEYDRKVLIELVKRHFPDFRRLIGELQKFSAAGKIDVGCLSQGSEVKIDEAIAFLRDKDFRSMRKWIGMNADNDSGKILHQLMERMGDIVKPEYVPAGIVLIGKYHRDIAFSADHEVTLAAFVCEFMIEMEMKS